MQVLGGEARFKILAQLTQSFGRVSLTRQCVAGRRFGDVRSLRAETKAWSSDFNGAQRGVDWQMKIGDARCKLASVYPKIKL